MDLEHFIHKWQGAKLKERQAYQEHFRDLCTLFDQRTPSQADTQGDWYCFEFGAKKPDGSDGWADVYKRDFFGWEYKGKHKDLDAAYQQLLDYRVSLRNPPLLIVCDLDRFRIYTNFTNSDTVRYEFDLAALPEKSKHKPELTNFQVLQAVFENPEVLRIGRDPLQVTEEVAKHLGEIAISMRGRGIDPLLAAHFVMKLVFCLFAERVALLPGMPMKKIAQTGKIDFNRKLANKLIAELISYMDTGKRLFTDEYPCFNGGLFDGSPAIPLENGELHLLEQVAEPLFDWSRIEPSIFGTLLERSIDPKRQKQLGAHYTRPEEVMKVIEPVVLDPLREEWFDVRAKVQLIAGPKNEGAARKLIENFLARLRGLRILDPACGSGNFLYLALRAVMDLESEVRRFAHKANIPILAEEHVGPEILLGREIDPYAKELASTVIWIGFIQKRLETTGKYSDRPVLRPLTNIVLADSILNEDGTRPEWPACDYIVGNPPFLGGKKMRRELGQEYTEVLHVAYSSVVDRDSDLCCYFHEQARQHLVIGYCKRAGLLATNSIRDVHSRSILSRINKSTPIYNAWSDLDWILEGANVRISIICYGRIENIPSNLVLNGEIVNNINDDLSTGLDLTQATKLEENRKIAFRGDLKVGKFELTEKQAIEMLNAKGNPNEKSNSDVIRPWLNGKQFLYPQWRHYFIIDFGIHMSIEDASKYVLPFEHIASIVFPKRKDNPVKSRRERWWIHGSPASDMRDVLRHLDRFLATPLLTQHRVFRLGLD